MASDYKTRRVSSEEMEDLIRLTNGKTSGKALWTSMSIIGFMTLAFAGFLYSESESTRCRNNEQDIKLQRLEMEEKATKEILEVRNKAIEHLFTERCSMLEGKVEKLDVRQQKIEGKIDQILEKLPR